MSSTGKGGMEKAADLPRQLQLNITVSPRGDLCFEIEQGVDSPDLQPKDYYLHG